MKTKVLRPEEADLFTGKARIDAEEQEYLAQEAARKGSNQETKGERIYRLTLGWAF